MTSNVKDGVPQTDQTKRLAAVLSAVHGMFSAQDILHAVKYLQDKAIEITTDTLIDAIYHIQSHGPGESSEQHSTDGHFESGNKSEDEQIEEDSARAESSLGREIEERDKKTKLIPKAKHWYEKQIESLKIICQYCNKHTATILLLPCSHVAACEYCLVDVRRCAVPSCKKIVRGTKQIFFV